MTQENKENKKSLFSEAEDRVSDFWRKNKIFEKSVEKPAGAEPKSDYVFYDGPPFITGLPHYASLLPSIAKDVVPRYQTMKGNRVERVWGWDCHGLPAENKVEKELGLRNKKDIENLGVDKFVGACRDYVNVGSDQWRWYIDKIGRWVDMDNAYKTMDIDFMESVIWAFKNLFEKGLIYEGYRTSLHCPRCATPLSKFELTMDAGSYREVEDETVIAKFELEDGCPTPGAPGVGHPSGSEGKTYLLAWTTTPWTLPGNLALAVGEDIEYVKISYFIKKRKKDGEPIYENIILSKEIYEKWMNENNGEIFDKLFSITNYSENEPMAEVTKIVGEFKGSELVGKKYKPLFDLKNEKIKQNDSVYKIYTADFVNTEEGTGIVHIAPNFGEDDFNLGERVGLPILDLMDENGIYTSEAGEEWQGEYYKKAGQKVLDKLGDAEFTREKHNHQYPHCYRCDTRLIYRAQKAWYLRISEIRQKMLETNKEINWFPEYFGEGRFKYNLENAPDWCLSRSRYWGSPIPVWKCEKCDKKEVMGSIAEIEKKSGQKISELHRPEIDEPEWDCECGGKMKRVKEVLDCWFESGSMPFGQFHYPEENKEKFENKMFPADFIIEYTGQLRGWFYYLHVLANSLFDDKAFKNVIVTGVLAGTDGRKMSKSYGNYPDPRETIEKYGADALRMYFMGSQIMLGNDMNLSERDIQDALRKNIMILNNVVRFYEMFSQMPQASSKNPPTPLIRGALKVDNVLDRWILARLNQLIGEVTENMEAYNLPGASRPITDFIDDLSTWYIRRSRDRFKGEDEDDKNSALETTGYVLLELSKVIAPFMPFLAEQVWQKIAGYNFENPEMSVHLEKWPLRITNDELRMTNEIISDMEQVRLIVGMALQCRDKENIKVKQPLNKLLIFGTKIKDEYIDLIKEEVNVKAVEFFRNEESGISVGLDTKITPELRREGLKRELVRAVNNLRKNENLTIEDEASVSYKTDSEDIKKAIEEYSDELKKDTLSNNWQEDPALEGKNFKLGEEEIVLSVEKV